MATPDHRSASQPKAGEACELLFELYDGATGPVRLGRMLAGKNAGRLVMLRPVDSERVLRARTLIDRVRHISHPKLLKVMGCYRIGEQDYLASEYIAGVSFVELRQRLKVESANECGAIVRIMRDVLLATHSGRRLFEGIYGRRVERCVFADTIWLAEFGEVFITELAVFEAMTSDASWSGVRGMGYLEGNASAEAADIRAAGELLFEWMSVRDKSAGLLGVSTNVSKALADIVSRALGNDKDAPFESSTVMAQALSHLPGLGASSDELRAFLKESLQGVLELRRQKLRILERSSAVAGDSEATQFHRASGLSRSHELETVRPSAPAGSGTHPTMAGAPTIPALRLPDFARSTPVAVQRAGEGPPLADAERAVQTTSPHRASKALGSDDVPTVVPPPDSDAVPTRAFRPDALSDDETTVWVSNTAAMPGLDEDATAIYVATKDRPVEPSVIIQDGDETNLYLRAKTERSLRQQLRIEEETTLSERQSIELFTRHLERRRRWAIALLFTILFVLSAGLTVAVSKFGQLPW